MNFLKNFHIKSNHLNDKYLIKNIKYNVYFYKGIYKDIESIRKECTLCSLKKIKFKKHKDNQIILFKNQK